MAKLHTLTVQEGVNAGGPGGQWTVNGIATHAGTTEAHTKHLDVSGAAQLGVLAAGELYFNFSSTTEDVETDNDLYLPANTLIFITVPRGIGNTIYFNHLGKGAACATRVVEV